MVKITGISDLHGYLPYDLPECDVICICGDIVPLNIQRDFEESLDWFGNTFSKWADEQKAETIIIVGGNHDFFLEKLCNFHDITDTESLQNYFMENLQIALSPKIQYLLNGCGTFAGVNFYGTPYVSGPWGWAFYKEAEPLRAIYEQIPEKTDVIITHQPPKIGDAGKVLQDTTWVYGQDFGSEIMSDVLKTRKFKWLLCGHVHSGNHEPFQFKRGMKVANVSLKDEQYRVKYKPLVFNV